MNNYKKRIVVIIILALVLIGAGTTYILYQKGIVGPTKVQEKKIGFNISYPPDWYPYGITSREGISGGIHVFPVDGLNNIATSTISTYARFEIKDIKSQLFTVRVTKVPPEESMTPEKFDQGAQKTFYDETFTQDGEVIMTNIKNENQYSFTWYYDDEKNDIRGIVKYEYATSTKSGTALIYNMHYRAKSVFYSQQIGDAIIASVKVVEN